VARVDTAAVERWYISDPAEPAQPPRAVRYPVAGTANAEVTLWIIGLDGARTPVQWDIGAFEYVPAAGWDDHGPFAAVQSRDQREHPPQGTRVYLGAPRAIPLIQAPVTATLVGGQPQLRDQAGEGDRYIRRCRSSRAVAVTQLISALSTAGYGSGGRSVMTSPPERSAVSGGVACEPFMVSSRITATPSSPLTMSRARTRCERPKSPRLRRTSRAADAIGSRSRPGTTDVCRGCKSPVWVRRREAVEELAKAAAEAIAAFIPRRGQPGPGSPHGIRGGRADARRVGSRHSRPGHARAGSCRGRPDQAPDTPAHRHRPVRHRPHPRRHCDR